ncbi:MAG: pantetheine-phosphate adenylyltransferase [Clostridiales bacterium]|jgi:pantetheine-phosphate adenylyltransferase|nr:pantetheine-phosphate adenylyltransferase [Clostridiales bacterium]
MRAIYPGSFSPPTLGHLDIIRRAAKLFGEVVVAVLSQSEKRYLFSLEERKDMLRRILIGVPNARVVSDTGLLADVAKREGADVILRGIRDASDLPLEMQMAAANRQIGGVDTVFLVCSPEYSLLSSSIVRDCARHRAPIAGMVPPEIVNDIYAACLRDVGL